MDHKNEKRVRLCEDWSLSYPLKSDQTSSLNLSFELPSTTTTSANSIEDLLFFERNNRSSSDKRNKKFIDVKNEKSSTQNLKYTKLRLKREEFRKRIVDLIVNTDDDKIDRATNCYYTVNNDPTVKYDNYVKSGLDTLRTARLSANDRTKILKRIPEKYKISFAKLIDKLLDEIDEEYVSIVKKIIVDFALNGPTMFAVDSVDAIF